MRSRGIEHYTNGVNNVLSYINLVLATFTIGFMLLTVFALICLAINYFSLTAALVKIKHSLRCLKTLALKRIGMKYKIIVFL